MKRHVKPAAYARHRGVTRQAVHDALRRGRIHREDDGLIDPRRADREWAANTSPTNGGERGRKGTRRGRKAQAPATPKPSTLTASPETRTTTAKPRGRWSKAAPSPPEASSIEAPKPAADAPEPPLPAAGQGLIDAKTVRENWAGRRAELDYRQRAGELLDRAEVVKAIGDGARAVQERLLGLIPRLSQTLAPERPPHEVAMMLTEEITRALAGLTQLLARFAGEEAA